LIVGIIARCLTQGVDVFKVYVQTKESVWQLRFRSSGAKALTDNAGFMSWLKPQPTKISEFSHRL